MSDDTDAMLTALLATPERAPDDRFALRIGRLVEVEKRLGAARRAAWSRFAAEMAAAASLILAFLLVERLAPADSPDLLAPFGPAAAGLMLLVLWVAVSYRPGSGAAAE
jgi:hypothetical protein